MNAIVVYKSTYGSTKKYAEWIAEDLSRKAVDVKNIRIDELLNYDTIIYGGGLYAETIAGISIITKNLDKLEGKKIIVFTTGLTPVDSRDYYDKIVAERNFKGDALSKIKIFNFLGKMIVSELSFVHKTAIISLKNFMLKKKNPTEMEKMLINLCDSDGDFTDRNSIKELVDYAIKQ